MRHGRLALCYDTCANVHTGVDAMGKENAGFYLLVAGPWREDAEVIRALSGAGIEAQATRTAAGSVGVEVIDDPELSRGFGWCFRGPTGLEKVVEAYQSAALIHCPFFLQEQPQLVSRLGQALLDNGGVAVRTEGSGSASLLSSWVKQVGSGAAAQLFRSSVLFVGEDGGRVFTVGMHQLGLPDAQLRVDDPQEAFAWLEAFCVYQLVEQPALVSGHTFAPWKGSERRHIERWPDHRHHVDDGRHNPFGVWRLPTKDASRVTATGLPLVHLPSLIATLMGTESRKGRPLTRTEVESLVDDSPAIAMEAADALVLERSRGYADLLPELAWEQWQLYRQVSE